MKKCQPKMWAMNQGKVLVVKQSIFRISNRQYSKYTVIVTKEKFGQKRTT